VTYDNGVLVLVMPRLQPGQPKTGAEIWLETIRATRGECVRHAGRDVVATTTREHRGGKHNTGRWSSAPPDSRDVSPPAK